MSVYNRIKQRANNNYANNFATILERKYAETNANVIEQIFEDNSKAYVLTENTLEIASFTQLQRTADYRAPITLHIDSYPLSKIVKISESYEQHALQNDDYLSLNTTIHFTDGEKVVINDSVGLYTGELLRGFYEDHKSFIQELKKKL